MSTLLNDWELELVVSTPYPTNVCKEFHYLMERDYSEALNFLNDQRFVTSWEKT
jgi:hypothetical protein